MKVLLLMFMLVVASPTAWGEYSSVKIKAGIDAQHQIFGVSGWKKSDNGRSWIAVSNVKDQVLSLDPEITGLIATIESPGQVVNTLIRCLALGSIGLNPQTERDRERIGDVVLGASKGRNGSVNINGVNFNVSAKQLGAAVFFSCVLKPTQ